MEFVDYNGNDIPLLNEFPIGTVLITVTNSNPSNFTAGTWVSFGTGRTIVGVDTTQDEFNSVEKTGGSKSNTHNHYTLTSNDFSAFYMTASGRTPRSRVIPASRGSFSVNNTSEGNARQDSTYDETIDILQPYITVYMWKRTV